MTTPLPAGADIAHITPIACASCGPGHAHLVRCLPDAFKRDRKTELWTFQCDSCGQQFTQSVDS